jgi:hypothetical protein
MRLHEDRICRTCCPVQAGEALAPEHVDAKVVDTLPCNCKAVPLPLVMGSEAEVDRSLKCISAVIWQREHVVFDDGWLCEYE